MGLANVLTLPRLWLLAQMHHRSACQSTCNYLSLLFAKQVICFFLVATKNVMVSIRVMYSKNRYLFVLSQRVDEKWLHL